MSEIILEQIVGDNIARYRGLTGLTQAQLAEKIGVSTAFLSRVERGQKMMKVRTLYATAQALGVSCDALLRADGPTPHLENIKLLFSNHSDYVDGIEKVIRVCLEEFMPKAKETSDLL